MAAFRAFARWFGGGKPMSALGAADAQLWASSLSVGENTRTRYVSRLSGLWEWAAKPQRQWVSDNPWRFVETEPLSYSTPGVLTIEQVAELLAAAREEPETPMLPSLVLMLFCGIRVAEICRLGWNAVRIEAGEEGVGLDPQLTKHGTRRWIPMPPAAIAWLRTHKGMREGGLAPKTFKFRRERLLARAGFHVKARTSNNGDDRIGPMRGDFGRWQWPSNGLRHSYCSYAVAHFRNLAEVAYWAGNSERILRRDYVALVTRSAGDTFFSLMPETVDGFRFQKR